MKKKARRKKGIQKGPQQHAEGMHGEKTHERIIEQLQTTETNDEPNDEPNDARPQASGEHRLLERRQQHDEAEKNSEKERLSRYLDENHLPRTGHDVPGGH